MCNSKIECMCNCQSLRSYKISTENGNQIVQGRPKCSCPNGGEIERPKRVKPCSKGR